MSINTYNHEIRFFSEEETTVFDYSFNANYFEQSNKVFHSGESQKEARVKNSCVTIKELEGKIEELKLRSLRLSELCKEKSSTRAKIISRASTCDELDDFLFRSSNSPDIITVEKINSSCMSG